MRPNSAALLIRAGTKPNSPAEIIRKPETPMSEMESFHERSFHSNPYYRDKIEYLKQKKPILQNYMKSENCRELFLQGKSQLNLEIEAVKNTRNAIIDLDLVDKFSPEQKKQIIRDKFGSLVKEKKVNQFLFDENEKCKELLAKLPCKEETYVNHIQPYANWKQL